MTHRPAPRRLAATAALASVLVLGLAACGDEPVPGTTDPSTDPSAPPSAAPTAPATPAPTTAATTDAPDDGALRLDDLAVGPAPGVDYLAGATLRVDGRTVETDLPARVTSARLMGVAGGRVVVEGFLEGARGGTHYWAVDRSGRTQELGDGPYESYGSAPVLVEETGHLWVTYSDRGTGASTTWELDVATGRELLELRGDDDVPSGLAPADQAVLDRFEGQGDVVPGAPTVTSPDGTLTAVIAERALGGTLTYRLVVRHADDREVVLRLPIAPGPVPPGAEVSDVLPGPVLFEDDAHVLLVLTNVTGDASYVDTTTRRAVVRCDLDGACERATDVVEAVALGLDQG